MCHCWAGGVSITGYGLSIHKSQGMTLSSHVVHCNGIFEAGQLSVVIGRVFSSKGLSLIGYRKRMYIQPKPVKTLAPTSPLFDDLSCYWAILDYHSNLINILLSNGPLFVGQITNIVKRWIHIICEGIILWQSGYLQACCIKYHYGNIEGRISQQV